MSLSKETKEKYLRFCGYRLNNFVYREDETVKVETHSAIWGNGMGTNEYYTFSVGKREDKKVLCQDVKKTDSKWEYDEYGGESPNNGEWTTEEYRIEYQVPDNFDLFNPDFSQVRKIGKIEEEYSSGRRK